MFSPTMAKLCLVVVLAALAASTVPATAQDPALPCKKFSEIYTSGKEICENMWDGAFEYTEDEDKAYTMWFFGQNPNKAVADKVFNGSNATDECHLDYYHVDGPPVKENDKFTECHPWKDAACCKHGTIETADNLLHGYGEKYRWDRCGKLSQECERFFVQEACFYECEPAAGLYRANPKSQTIADILGRRLYNASAHPDGSWKMEKMPIKASYCNAWMDACKNDMFCGAKDGSFFSCARDYPAPVPTPATTANTTLAPTPAPTANTTSAPEQCTCPQDGAKSTDANNTLNACTNLLAESGAGLATGTTAAATLLGAAAVQAAALL